MKLSSRGHLWFARFGTICTNLKIGRNSTKSSKVSHLFLGNTSWQLPQHFAYAFEPDFCNCKTRFHVKQFKTSLLFLIHPRSNKILLWTQPEIEITWDVQEKFKTNLQINETPDIFELSSFVSLIKFLPLSSKKGCKMWFAPDRECF